jgi:hypothetical protein
MLDIIIPTLDIIFQHWIFKVVSIYCHIANGVTLGVANPPPGYGDRLLLHGGRNDIDPAVWGIFAAHLPDPTLGGALTIQKQTPAPDPPPAKPPTRPQPPKPGFTELLKQFLGVL